MCQSQRHRCENRAVSWCEGEDVAKEVVVEVGQEGAGAGHRVVVAWGAGS